MHPKMIKRAAALLALVTLTGSLLTGCTPSDGTAARIRVETPLSEKGFVSDLADSAKNGAFAATEAEKTALAGMTLQLENDAVALYTGKYTDIAVLDKETGHIWFSNPAVYRLMNDPFAVREKKVVYSPVWLEYYDNSNRSTVTAMYVYDDCINDNGLNQAEITVENGTLQITYLFGQRQEDMLYMQAMTPELYHRLDDTLGKMAEDGEIEYSDWGLLEKSYEPPESNGTGCYFLYSTVSNLDLERFSALMRKVGITAEDVAAQEKATGFYKVEKNTAWFKIPVVYQLQGRDLLASIDYRNIEIPVQKGRKTSKYKLNRIYLLGTLGASETGTEGYLLVPNGSGMLVKNDTTNGDMSKITLPFYGTDYAGILKESSLLSPSNTLPVFGSYNGAAKTAVFGIVESADAQSGVVAGIADSESPFNRIFPYCDVYIRDEADAGVSSKLEKRNVFSKSAADTVFRVRYHFLYGDNAEYAGMAAYYRSYLEQTGAIKRMTEADPLITVELLGSIRKKTTTFGVPVTISQPLTTFAQAQEILGALEKKGVADPDVVLSGVFNGGLDNKLSNRAAVQKDLGGKSGYQSLRKAMEEKGLTVYTAQSPVLVYRSGNGFSASSSAVRNLEGRYASLAAYSPATGNRFDYLRTATLLTPLDYQSVMERFLRSFEKLGTSPLYLSDIGSMLPSDRNENREIHREQAKYYAAQTAAAAASAAGAVMLDGGNAYLLPYAEKLIDVRLTADGYELQYQSLPFVQMVLHGYVSYSGSALNMASDPDRAVLEAAETGAGLYYKLMYEDNTILLNTQFTSLYSTNYTLWIDRMAAQQEALSALYASVATCRMTGYVRLTGDVSCTTYENGTRVLVNYGKSDYTADGQTVKAGSFAVIS